MAKYADSRIFLRNGFFFTESERIRISKTLQTTFGFSLVYLAEWRQDERIDFIHVIGGTVTQTKAIADAWMALHRYHILLHDMPDRLTTPEIRLWADGFPEWAQDKQESLP